MIFSTGHNGRMRKRPVVGIEPSVRMQGGGPALTTSNRHSDAV